MESNKNLLEGKKTLHSKNFMHKKGAQLPVARHKDFSAKPEFGATVSPPLAACYMGMYYTFATQAPSLASYRSKSRFFIRRFLRKILASGYGKSPLSLVPRTALG